MEIKPGSSPTALGSGSRPGVVAASQALWGSGGAPAPAVQIMERIKAGCTLLGGSQVLISSPVSLSSPSSQQIAVCVV